MQRVYAVAEWGGILVASYFPTADPERVVLHHTAGPNVTPKVLLRDEERRGFALARAIQRDHMSRRPPYADSGHHFLVLRSGLILEGRKGSWSAAQRGRVVRGAHSGNAEVNRTGWGVEVEGTLSRPGDLLPAQREALVELCAWLCWRGDVDTATIAGHRQFTQTLCPGDGLWNLLPEIRRAAHSRKFELLRL